MLKKLSTLTIMYKFLIQKFDNRGVVVLEGEMKYWKHITIDYMSEEFDDLDDANVLVVHPLPWRSQSMYIHSK